MLALAAAIVALGGLEPLLRARPTLLGCAFANGVPGKDTQRILGWRYTKKVMRGARRQRPVNLAGRFSLKAATPSA